MNIIPRILCEARYQAQSTDEPFVAHQREEDLHLEGEMQQDSQDLKVLAHTYALHHLHLPEVE